MLSNTEEVIVELKRSVEYHPSVGLFIFKKHTSRRSRGEIAGRLDGEGYLRFCIGGVEDRSHRWAYMYMVGCIPDNMAIDHIDRNRLNNRWENLRLVTVSENNFNRDYPKTIKKNVIR